MMTLTFFKKHRKMWDFGVVITEVMVECSNNSNFYSIIF